MVNSRPAVKKISCLSCSLVYDLFGWFTFSTEAGENNPSIVAFNANHNAIAGADAVGYVGMLDCFDIQP